MKNRLFIGLFSLLVIAVGYFSYINYKQHQLVKLLEPTIKDTSLRITSTLSESSTMAIDKIDSDVAKINEYVLEVQAISTPSNKNITDPVLLYLRNSALFLQAVSVSSLNLKLAEIYVQKSEKAIAETKTSSDHYLSKLLLQVADAANHDATKKFEEYNKSINVCLTYLIKIKDARSNITTFMPNEDLPNPVLLDTGIKKLSAISSKTDNFK